MASNDVEVCNLALIEAGSEPITALSDATPRARLCNLIYAQTKSRLLQKHPWNFAKTLVTLAVRVDAPPWKWLHWYDLPADFLRLRQIENLGVDQWEIIDRQICTDQDESINLLYTADVTEDRFSPLFTQALVLTLAVPLARKLADSSSLVGDLETRAEMALREAKTANALENPPMKTADSDWITVRN